MTVLRKYILF